MVVGKPTKLVFQSYDPPKGKEDSGGNHNQRSHKDSTPLPVFSGSLWEPVGIVVKSEIYAKQGGVTG